MKIGNFRKFAAIAVYAVIFLFACEDKNNYAGNNYVINSLSANGSTSVPTTKLTITVNDDSLALTAGDIKINAGFSVIKGALTKTDTMTYELFITPGSTGTIRAGLDPYRGFTGWDAKTANVYADWYFSGTSELTITGKYNLDDTLEIPEEIAGIPVTAIGDRAFYNERLTAVAIPNSITAIGDNAFAYNQLTNIVIPEGVEYIGTTAFAYNQLSVININESVTAIGAGAFAYNQLSDVTIPEKITSIGYAAFAYNQLTNVTISESIVYIGDNVFAYNELSVVTVPAGVVHIGNGAFANNKLTSITISGKVTYIGNSAFAYNKLSEINIPAGVKNIDIRAFYDNPLTSIKIGEDVVLGSYSFGNGFESAYNIDYNRAAGTYTRPDTNSNEWSK